MSKRIISGTSGADDIRCPFYIANGSLDIICQGVIPDTHSIIRYRFKNDKVTQQKAFCEGCYNRCEIYQSIMHFREWDEE